MEHILGQGQQGTPIGMPDIKTLPAVKCPKCGCAFFNISYILRVVPRVISPDGNEHIIPDTVFKCTECGSVLGYTDKDEEENDSDNTSIFEDTVDESIDDTGDLKIVK
jgi:hypothetical protein